jgi:hypothetical protein
MPELKERLEAIANEGEPLGAAEVMRRARSSIEPGGRTGRRRVLVSLVAAAAAAALVVGVVVQRSRDDGPSVVAEGGHDEQAGGPGQDGDATLFLVPSAVPEGFELIEASGGDQPGASAGGGGTGADWEQHYVRFDPAHERPVEILDLAWATDARFDDLVNLPPGAIRATVRGHDGWYSAELGRLVWEEPAGQRVTLQGSVAGEGPTDQTRASLPLDFLQTVAEALEPRDGGGFDLPGPPGGFELVAEAPGEYSDGSNPRTLAYRGPDGRGLWLNLVDDSERPPGLRLYYSTDRLVDVRGRQGVFTPTRGPVVPGSFDQETLFISAGADLHLQWVEPGNVQVTMSGVGMTESELFAIAESLESVDAETWFGLRDQTAPPDRRAPSRPVVLVVNAGAPPGSASTLANVLVAVGYNVLPAADTSLLRTGRGVQCRAPFESAAPALALAVASDGGAAASVEVFADPGVASAGDADCLVYVGVENWTP